MIHLLVTPTVMDIEMSVECYTNIVAISMPYLILPLFPDMVQYTDNLRHFTDQFCHSIDNLRHVYNSC